MIVLLLLGAIAAIWISGVCFAVWAFLHFMGNVRIGTLPEERDP